MSGEAGLLPFVAVIAKGSVGRRRGEMFVTADGRTATVRDIRELASMGVLTCTGDACRRNDATVTWLKRARLEAAAMPGPHRILSRGADGVIVNLAESPLLRLASGEGAFLEPHHVAAGERVRQLAERAQLQPRVTLGYSAERVGGSRTHVAGEISDMAADARRAVAEIHRLLPPDCASVVIDVCGLLKGLQEVERDRQWPRRSAKLVLRIGLDQLAQHYGYSPMAVGNESRQTRGWLGAGARPDRFE